MTPSAPSQPCQGAILAAVPAQARYLFLSRESGIKPAAARKAIALLARALAGKPHVIGFSATLAKALGRQIPGLRDFVRFPDARVDLPVTQSDVWIWLRGNDAGELFHETRLLLGAVAGLLKLDELVPAFRFRSGHDLSGYEDGTENPKGAQARRWAIAPDGASFVAVQRWEHRFERFDAMSPKARNEAVGRDLASNEELPDAPDTAHVKRTAQESFDPQAFVLRRSMPWTEGARAGLMFVAFGRSFDAFEAQLERMSGAADGRIDGLFGFTRPLGGGYYWCPPLAADGRPDVSALG